LPSRFCPGPLKGWQAYLFAIVATTATLAVRLGADNAARERRAAPDRSGT
jgi:hypothetical protein